MDRLAIIISIINIIIVILFMIAEMIENSFDRRKRKWKKLNQ